MTQATSEGSSLAWVHDAPIHEVVERLQRLFGQKLTAVIVDVPDPREIGRWARQESAPYAGAERRLRTACLVAMLLRRAESEKTVQSWFMGTNDLLGGRAPALVLKDEPDRVIQAARVYLAGG